MRPAVVVPLFNRPHALKRLLDSILQSDFSQADGPVPLVFSLEGGAHPDCVALVEDLRWPHGPKRVIQRPCRMGLREHLLACGDLTSEYGAILLLEDDLLVSPGFFTFAERAAAFYAEDARIGGVSLYAFLFNEFGGFPFVPLDDGQDMYFVQSASSWGQVWTERQWSAFRTWLRTPGAEEGLAQDVRLPEAVRQWSEHSWKKLFNGFLVDTGRYFAVPRQSLTTNLGEQGTHYHRTLTCFTQPLPVRPRGVLLSGLDESLSRYDAFFELEPGAFRNICPHPLPAEFTIDFHGLKPLELIQRTPWALTLRAGERAESTFRFGLRLLPPELNAAYGIAGQTFSLVPSDQVREESPAGKVLAIRSFFCDPALVPAPPAPRRRWRDKVRRLSPRAWLPAGKPSLFKRRTQ